MIDLGENIEFSVNWLVWRSVASLARKSVCEKIYDPVQASIRSSLEFSLGNLVSSSVIDNLIDLIQKEVK